VGGHPGRVLVDPRVEQRLIAPDPRLAAGPADALEMALESRADVAELLAGGKHRRVRAARDHHTDLLDVSHSALPLGRPRSEPPLSRRVPGEGLAGGQHVGHDQDHRLAPEVPPDVNMLASRRLYGQGTRVMVPDNVPAGTNWPLVMLPTEASGIVIWAGPVGGVARLSSCPPRMKAFLARAGLPVMLIRMSPAPRGVRLARYAVTVCGVSSGS